jgi:transketolase
MASIAAGLAISGFKVVMYSIGNFTTLRCLEQIRNNICYHDCNVKIISVGGGMAYGSLGMTHHATEDIGIMRSLPNMSIYAPFDPIEAEQSITDAFKSSHPCYIRLERNNEFIYNNIKIRDVNDITEFKSGIDYAIVSYGSIVSEALKCYNVYDNIGIYSITKLKGIDTYKII